MLRCGRRGGKTSGSSILAVEALVEKEQRVLYAVPTQDQIARFWHEVVQSLAELIEYGIVKKYESDKIVEYPGTERRIKAKTAWNADSLRGDYGDLIILDEFQLMNEDALDVVVYPMLADHNGDLVLIYTPPRLHSRSTSKATDKRHAAKLFKEKKNDPRWECMTWTSYDNPHVSSEGLAEISIDMTALGKRLEIMAEDVDDVPGALWNLKLLDDTRVTEIPAKALPLVRVVIAVDPTGSSTNEAGIVAAAKGSDGHGYVLADASLLAPTARTWAAAAVWEYHDKKADRLVAEHNFGGDMVKGVVDAVDPNISYKVLHASRGKIVRAEPIAALYEKHRMHHVGTFPKLEEEMSSYVPGLSPTSPNRMDALVWAMTELFPESLRLTLADAQAEEVQKHEADIAKSKLPEKPGTCGNCQSTLIVKRGPVSHCNSCGNEWGFLPPPAAGGRKDV